MTSAAQAAALVFASDPRFGSIHGLNPGVAGQSAWYEATDTSNGYSVQITMGSGDCQSGCINQHTWNYSVSTGGAIKLVSEQGDPVEGPSATPNAAPATVTIRLVAGPVCPVERNPPDPSCAPRPVPNVEIVLYAPTGTEVGRATAGADGTAQFSVPGGAYYAQASDVQSLMGQPGPIAFSVPGGASTTITMEYDTGIR